MRAVSLAEEPPRRSLLPDELSVRVGCIGCIGTDCGVTRVSETTKAERLALRQDLKTAQQITGVPVTVSTTAFIETYHIDNTAMICNNGACPGDTTGLFKDILEEG